MVSATALHGFPEAIRAELGPFAERRAFRNAGLTPDVLAFENAFIPEQALVTFIDSTAREAGIQHLGLVLAPHLTLAGYGTWGRYLLESETLGESLVRLKSLMPLHHSCSTPRVDTESGLTWIHYELTTMARRGYANFAFCVAGILINFVRKYTGTGWQPEVVALNIPSPRRKAEIEECFACPIMFDARHVSIGFGSDFLGARRRLPEPEQPTTLSDVRRARCGVPPNDLNGAVQELVRVQVRSRAVSLDAAAAALGYGMRRLQRALDREGTSFREITRRVRLATAKELLAHTSLPLSAIGRDIGYADPAHFTRAFRRDAGCSPTQYPARFADAAARPIVF
jgi:AraC-like DNA-binding protein